jgi:hypothetical protein
MSATWRQSVAPPADHRFSALLVTLGLEHHISWTTAGLLLNAYERSLAPAPPPPPRMPTTAWSNPFGDTPRDLAAWISYGEAMAGHVIEMHPRHWHAATATEAYMLDLHPDNPGDHSGLHTRTVEQLMADLVALRRLPRSAWRHERIQATELDLNRRRGLAL